MSPWDNNMSHFCDILWFIKNWTPQTLGVKKKKENLTEKENSLSGFKLINKSSI